MSANTNKKKSADKYLGFRDDDKLTMTKMVNKAIRKLEGQGIVKNRSQLMWEGVFKYCKSILTS